MTFRRITLGLAPTSASKETRMSSREKIAFGMGKNLEKRRTPDILISTVGTPFKP